MALNNRLINYLRDHRFIIVSGKGGVGKTTFSSALALRLSEIGRTLVVSIDPAHSLGDSFDRSIGNNVTKITKNLFALEFDPVKLFATEREAIIKALREDPNLGATIPLSDESLELLYSLQLPYEFAEGMGFIRLVYSLIDDDNYDFVVIDTAPTGHTVELLKLPEILESTYVKMIKFRLKISRFFSKFRMLFGMQTDDTSDKLLDILERGKEEVQRVREILTNEKMTEFIVVMIPNDMSILESLRLIGELEAWEIPNHHVNVNFVRIYSGPCKFSNNLSRFHLRQLKKIKDKLGDKSIWVTPYFSEEIRGLEKLRRLSEYIGKIDIDSAIQLIEKGETIE